MSNCLHISAIKNIINEVLEKTYTGFEKLPLKYEQAFKIYGLAMVTKDVNHNMPVYSHFLYVDESTIFAIWT